MAGSSRFKIVVRKVEAPFSHDLEEELNWICGSLGFFKEREKGCTPSSVFREIVLSGEKGTTLSSTELSRRVKMSRGAVINHLNNLVSAGLVVKHGRRYESRSRSMFRTMEEIEEDIERIFNQIKKAAREIDKELGIDF